jgi:hypothetical protein
MKEIHTEIEIHAPAKRDGAEYRSRFRENGFEVVSHVAEDPGCGHHTVWIARLN